MVNSPKNFRKKALVLAATLALSPLLANAAGLGRITVQSGLGQPLRAELEVTAAREEIPSLTAKLASIDAFRTAGIEYQSALSSVQFSREVKERNGRRYIEMVSDKPINEPFVDMLIELSWSSGRLVREYTFLLDPPELVKAPPPPAPTFIPEVKTVERAPIMIPAMSAGKSVADAPALAINRPVMPPAPRPSPMASGDGNTHKVVSGDTLGKIAAQTKPEGISLDQMLVALFQNNKDAFSGDNMNRLKAGKILNIPSADVAGKIQKAEARREIVAQAADFNVYRSKLAALAGSAPAAPGGASQTSAGKITPKVTDSVPKAVSGDKLEVSKSAGGKAGSGVDAKGKPLQGRLSSIEEDLIARDRALREANSRIGDLEKNLTDLKKLAELKSQAGAAMQKQAETAKVGPAPVTPPAAATPPAAGVTPPATSLPPAPSDASKAEAAKPPVAKPDAPKPADTAPAKAKPAAAAPPAPEPDFIEENGLLLKVLAVFALLGGFFGFSALRKRRKVKDEVIEPMTPSSLSANSVFSDSSTLGDSTVAKGAPTDYSVSQAATNAIDEPLDPIVEADTFLAFGRDAQAEERLLEGLAADPGRHAIHVKLLEIYSGRRSTLQFNTLAKDLYDQTGGTGADWERVFAMGQNLDPNNPLYQTPSNEPEPEPAPVDSEATMVFSAPPAAEAAPSGLDFDLGLDAEETPPEPEAVKAEGLNIDFDLDLGGDAPPAAAADAVVDLGSDISFDLDPPTEAVAAAPASSADASDISFDLEMPKAGGMEMDLPAVEMPKAAAANSDVDFDFDLGTVKLDAPLIKPAAAPAPLDLGGISLELDSPPPAAASGGADNPEAATKLELALAYEEMGDRDGARELLNEVLKEGSASQQAAAQTRLNQLG